MLNGTELVVDGTVHGFDLTDGNRADRCSPEEYAGFQGFMHQLAHVGMESREPGFLLDLEEFIPQVSAAALAEALFLESDTDVAFYHHVPIAGFFKHGVSRLDTGLELRKLAPDRVHLYGGVDTFKEDRQEVFAQIEEYAELGMAGLKFYPSNGIIDAEARRLVTMLYDDPELAWPYFEKAREVGLRHLAFHKAFPVGPSVEAAKPGDLLSAAVAFPELTFEIVHAGWAFLEETALEMMVHPNLYANLEISGSLILHQPRRFAVMLGELLTHLGGDRILFASGSAATHVDPLIRAFWEFEMPRDLQEGYGYPEVTPEIKRAILGLNMARLHGIDVDKMKQVVADDEWGRLRAAGKRPPWGRRRAEAASRV